MAEKVVIGNATLYLGDCREVLPALPAFDLLCTDPPYGMSAFDGSRTRRMYDMDRKKNWDSAPVDDDLMAALIAKCAAAIVWGGNYYTMPVRKSWLAWRKPDAPPTMAHFELAWTSLSMNARQIDHSIAATNAERIGHPAQKPLRVMVWSLSFAPNAQTVLDAFMGSGTTGVACAQLGKAFTGIERERKYFDIACQRIYNAQCQSKLFGADEDVQKVQPEQAVFGFPAE